MRIMLKSKIHRAHVTDSNINYEGSITIDKKLMAEADILPYEQVHVLNINNGTRFSTYAIEGQEGGGEICLNGAAARLGAVGDRVIIMAFCWVPEAHVQEGRHRPRIVHLDERNEPVERIPPAVETDEVPSLFNS